VPGTDGHADQKGRRLVNENPTQHESDAAAREVDGEPTLVIPDRTGSIGASDAAAALGISPWKSQFQLWAEKTGIAEPPDLDAVEAVEWGTRLELVIGKAFAERSGRDIRYNFDQTVERHPDRLWMTATPDAFQTNGNGRGKGVLQIKTTSLWNQKEWEDTQPIHYQVQVQHELAVTGLNWGTLCVLIGGQKMLYFDVDRNERFIEAMIAKEAFFWTQVLDRTPPDPDGSIATTDTLRRLYPRDDGETIVLPDDAFHWDEELQVCKKDIKAQENQRRMYENKIKAAMGTATRGVLRNSSMAYTHKLQTVNHKARKAWTNEFRVLRRCR